MTTDPKTEVDIAFVSDSMSSNSLGRVYCLWLLAERLGLRTVTVTATNGSVWRPLVGDPFTLNVHSLSDSGSEPWSRWRPRVIICVKPLPPSFRLARQWSRRAGVQMIIDIDEPDIEAGLGIGYPAKRVAKTLLRPRNTYWFMRAASEALVMPRIVSNPYLYRKYGGEQIPHVRRTVNTGPPPVDPAPTIAYVGTLRAHKGMTVLRRAVSAAQPFGYRLVVTAKPPADAQPWETWSGPTSLAAGIEIVARADVVVVPSLDTPFSRGQLPAKLVDAMLLGRAVVVSDLPPVRWASEGAGLIVAPGDVDDLVGALARLADPMLRADLGARARSRAVSLFTVDANIEAFSRILHTATGSGA